MEPREKLPKARINNQLKESANGTLDIYLKEVDNIPEICDKVYAMSIAIGLKLGKLLEDDQGDRKKKSANGGNRRGRKSKKEIKEFVMSSDRSENKQRATEGDNREKQTKRKRR